MVDVRRVVVVVPVSGDPWSPPCMRSTPAPEAHEDGQRATERETDGPKVGQRRGRAFFDGKRPTVLRWAGSDPDRMDCDHPGTGEYAPVGVRDGLSDFCVRTSGGYEADEDDGDGQQKMT
jgi:hypothetical protein